MDSDAVDLGDWPVSRLKKELVDRGARTTGRKTQLIDRLRAYIRNDNFTPASIKLPEPSVVDWPTSGFKQLQKDHHLILPKISKEQIEAYFIYRMADDRQARNDLKSITKGQLMYESDRVLACSILIHDNIYLSGIVGAAMKKKELDNLFSDHFGIHTDGRNRELQDDKCTESTDDEDEVDVDEMVNLRVSQFVQDRNDGSMDAREQENTEQAIGNTDEDSENLKCNCVNNCFENFNSAEIRDHIYRLREMTKDEKEMFIMGSIKQIGSKKITSKRKERKRLSYEYTFQGQGICRTAFMTINDTSEKVMKNISRHLNDNGAVPREHGNTGKKPTHALKYEDVQNAITFIINYAAEVGMPQPEAPRGSDGNPPIFLPSSDTKKGIHERYLASCEGTDVRALKLSSFTSAKGASASEKRLLMQ